MEKASAVEPQDALGPGFGRHAVGPVFGRAHSLRIRFARWHIVVLLDHRKECLRRLGHVRSMLLEQLEEVVFGWGGSAK